MIQNGQRDAAVSDYAFYGEGMAGGRLAWVKVPIRRFFRLVQRPWFLRQQVIFEELATGLAAQSEAISLLATHVAELRSALATSTRGVTGAGHRMISYAQNAEDVILDRAFPGRTSGLYIDVGAAHPTNDSVTRHFYDRGWRGINIDPLPEWQPLLQAERPEDVNLEVGVSSAPGEMLLHYRDVHPGGATLGTDADGDSKSVRVHLTTLVAICDEWVGEREIDFLKIDAEGHEREVIEGADWTRWKPRVVVVEATAPNSSRPNHEQWEPLLLAAGYVAALFDGLNRFYVQAGDDELRERLSVPANIFDDYVPYRFISDGAAGAGGGTADQT